MSRSSANDPPQAGQGATGSGTEAVQRVAVPPSLGGLRLDAVAARLFSDHSRSRLQRYIESGRLLANGRLRRPRDRLLGGEILELVVGDDADPVFDAVAVLDIAQLPAEPVDLRIVFSTASHHVLDKAPGLVMHPAPGHRHGTVMQGLLHLDPALRQVPRAGIVHRLDRDTTGLCVVARTVTAHTSLVRQLQAREVRREYLAVVHGDPPERATVDAPLARHPVDRKRMAVVKGGKPAVTHYQTLERYGGCALLAIRLETGRTHQIRVHLTHSGFPLVGDPVYRRTSASRALPSELRAVVDDFERQALHASHLAFADPANGRACSYSSELPADMAALIDTLRTAGKC